MASNPTNEISNPAGCGKESPILELMTNLVNTKQIKPNTITFIEVDVGDSQRVTTGAIPFLSKVNLNHDKYSNIKPNNPITPLLNERESQGPAGAKSRKVCITNNKPTTPKYFASCFGCITSLKGLGLKACGIIVRLWRRFWMRY